MKDRWIANGRSERNLLLLDEATSPSFIDDTANCSVCKRISDFSINPESIVTATTVEMTNGSSTSWLSCTERNNFNFLSSSHNKSLSSSSSSSFFDQPRKLDTAPVVPYQRPPSRESLDRKKKKKQQLQQQDWQLLQEQQMEQHHFLQQLQDQTYYNTRKDSLNYKNLRASSSFRNKRSSSSSVSSYFNTSRNDDSSFGSSSWGSSITSFRSSSLNTRSTSRCSITTGTNTTLTTKKSASTTTTTGGKAVLLFDMTDQMLQEHDTAVLMRGKLKRGTSSSSSMNGSMEDDIHTSISSMTSYNSLSFGDDGGYINKNYYHNAAEEDYGDEFLDETESYSDDDDDDETATDVDDTTTTTTSAYDDEEDDIYDIDEIEDEDEEEDTTEDDEDEEDQRLVADGVVVVAPTTSGGDGDEGEIDSDDCSISTCSSLDIPVHDPTLTSSVVDTVVSTSTCGGVEQQRGLVLVGEEDNKRPLKGIMKKNTVIVTAPTATAEPAIQQQLVNVADSKHKQSKKNSSTNSTRSKATKIQFDSSVLVKEITHLNDMTDDEIHTLYMNSEEAYEIRFDCLQLVQQLEEEGIQEEDEGRGEYCIRGLEKHTAKNNEQLLKKRELLYASVFKIQSLCLPPGLMDVEATIADICIKLTQESTTKAYQFGLLDAQEASKECNR